MAGGEAHHLGLWQLVKIVRLVPSRKRLSTPLQPFASVGGDDR
jgi:hypothetical protein